MIGKRGAEISGGKKEQATWGKITVQLEEINQKVLAKKDRLKRYRQRLIQYRQNRTFQNNERKFYQQLGGCDTKTTTRCKRNQTILDENMGTKETYRKYWMDKQYYKRARRTWRRPQNGNTRRLTQKNTKKNIKLESARPLWNTWLMVQEIHLHSRKTSTRNKQMLTRCASTWMDDQRKDYINPKGHQ